ncbi:MAG: ribulose-phosphate 3-epimerase [Peptostreptococcaceae bacterium]|nr:ribulose-phosphate 3-epimerase [Peptostreptococcaceae bacterium]
MKLSPSVLSADFANLERDIREVEKSGIEMLHIDVMDGHFVPNITIGPIVLQSIRKITDLELDVHLMISNPGQYINDFIEAGADILTIHAEADCHMHKTLSSIRESGIKSGVSINPSTPLFMIEEVADLLDLLLIMSVNPGFGGQSFIEHSLKKIEKASLLRKSSGLDFLIEVDGGIKPENAARVLRAGADILVAGSAIFKGKQISENIRLFKESANIVVAP